MTAQPDTKRIDAAVRRTDAPGPRVLVAEDREVVLSVQR
jgi:hypothetical protein